MRIVRLLACLFCAIAGPILTGPVHARAADLTMDFTWIGTPLCAANAGSPEFEVQNVPTGAARLRFTLISPDGSALGAGDVQVPPRGFVPRGAVPYPAPCVGGVYTWVVEALAADGARLASARLARPFY